MGQWLALGLNISMGLGIGYVWGALVANGLVRVVGVVITACIVYFAVSIALYQIQKKAGRWVVSTAGSSSTESMLILLGFVISPAIVVALV